jgi:hypothetical protein
MNQINNNGVSQSPTIKTTNVAKSLFSADQIEQTVAVLENMFSSSIASANPPTKGTVVITPFEDREKGKLFQDA